MPSLADLLYRLNDVNTFNEHVKAQYSQVLSAGAHDGAIHSIDYLDLIGLNLLPGYTPQFAVGRKTQITTGPYTILETDPFEQPPVGTNISMYIKSTSGDDADGGSGAQQVTVEYFEAAWGSRQRVRVTLDGTNTVAIPANINRIHKVYTNKGRAAAGTITIKDVGNSILYGGIAEYETFMRRCIFYVAEGETVLVAQPILGSTTSGGVNAVLFVTEEDEDGNTVTRGRATTEVADTTPVFKFRPLISISNPTNKPKAVGIAVNANSPSQKCTCTITGALINTNNAWE